MRSGSSRLLPLITGQAASVVLGLSVFASAAEQQSVSSALTFDIRKIAFSSPGSYFAVSHVTSPLAPLLENATEGEGLYLRNLHDGAQDRMLRLDVLKDRQPVAFETVATPGVLRLMAKDGALEICFATPDRLRIRGRGLGLRISKARPGTYDYALPQASGRWELNLLDQRMRYGLVPIIGALEVEAPFKNVGAEKIVADFLPDAEGTLEAAIEPYETHWKRHDPARPDFDACVEAAQAQFALFLGKLPTVAPTYEETRRLAAYVLWSSVVAPGGALKRPALLMSKNWMSRVWSWDHAFNALALVEGDPALAWDQFMLPFDQQHAGGALPDSLDGGLIWNFTKPPVHGLLLRLMMQRSPAIAVERLQEIYGPLSAWTEWWLAERDDDADGIPQYNHGNDSGWDNATTYRAGLPLEAPDLAAFLVVQMDVLADLAQKLGKPREGERWRARADDLLAKLLAHSWKGQRFVAPRSGDHRIADGDSLALFLPLVLGERLPEPCRRALVAGLKEGGRFSTAHGLATESVQSSYYEADGYWRGPIWAPPTLLLVEALARIGEKETAREIARRFCDVVATSGPAENFDAQSGRGLRDPAYTWTASVFVILASQYAR